MRSINKIIDMIIRSFFMLFIVGDISEWLGKAYDATPKALADGIEEILRDGQEITLPQKFSFDDVSLRWKDLLESL